MRIQFETTLLFSSSSLCFLDSDSTLELKHRREDAGLKGIKLNVYDSALFSIFYTVAGTTLDESGNGGDEARRLGEAQASERVESWICDYLKRRSSGIHVFIWVNFDKSEVYISRDSFGQVPIYYSFYPGNLVAFSTDISYLVNNILNTRDIDRNYINDYLAMNDGGKAYSGNTIYKNISTLLPATLNRFSSKEHTSYFYLKFEPQRWASLNLLEDFATEHRRLYEESLAKSVSNSSVIGAQLSGGLDSSSNVCTFRKLYPEKRINTFFYDTQTSRADESVFAEKVVSHVGSIHRVVQPSKSHLEAMIKVITITGQPITMINSPARHFEGLQFVKEVGCDTLLTGRGGENVMGYGLQYIENIIRDRRWEDLSSAISCLTCNDMLSSLSSNWFELAEEEKYRLVAKGYIQKIAKRSLRKGELIKYLYFLSQTNKHFGVSSLQVLVANLEDILNKAFAFWQPNYFEGIAASSASGLSGFGTKSVNQSTSLSYPYDLLYYPLVRVSEEFFALGNYFGLDVRNPFFSVDLYEFSLAVPDKYNFGNGRLRGIHREAMKGVLPEGIRLRTSKAIFDEYSYNTIMELYAEAGDFLGRESPIWNYVSKKKFENIVKILMGSSRGVKPAKLNRLLYLLYRGINLAVWLNIHKNNRVGAAY